MLHERGTRLRVKLYEGGVPGSAKLKKRPEKEGAREQFPYLASCRVWKFQLFS